MQTIKSIPQVNLGSITPTSRQNECIDDSDVYQVIENLKQMPKANNSNSES